MKKFTHKLKNLILFAATLIMFAALSQSALAQTNSKPNSAKDTVIVKQEIIDNCGKALEELSIYDKLLESKERELSLLKERLELEKERSKLYSDIADARKSESEAREAQNESLLKAIEVKNSQIANLEKEVEILKKKKPSLVKRILDVAAGIGIGILLK